MAGAILIVVALLVFPILVIMSGAAASAIIGEVSYRDARVRFKDSELLDLPD
ncbi:MAG: hypothetical protein WBP59_14815 [Ilumatobacteraceae bacterium]